MAVNGVICVADYLGHQFMGHLMSSEGVLFSACQIPPCVHGVERLCGMIQHLSKFLPNLASVCNPYESRLERMLTGIGPLNVKKHSRKFGFI